MKTLKKIFLLSLVAAFAVSCQDDDDRYNGSPDSGRLNIVTLEGTISTTAQSALTDQEIDWTVELPRTFSDTVLVEATAISNSGRRFRSSLIVEPNSNTATGEILAPGGAIFDTTFKLYLSGIALQEVEQGTHFLIKSDTLNIPTGNSGIPVQATDRIKVRLVWENASTTNSLQLTVDRPVLADINVPNAAGGSARDHAICNTCTSNSAALSSTEGDYIFNIKAAALTTSPVDMPYRIIVVFPNGDTEVYSGTYAGLTLASPLLPILKVTKTVTAGIPSYTTENLIP